MGAEPEHLAHRWIQRVEIAVAADGQHRVVGALPAQGAVAQLGCQCCVPPAEPPLREQSRQQQVRVGVPFGYGEQHVESGTPGRVPAGTAAAAGWLRCRTGLTGPWLARRRTVLTALGWLRRRAGLTAVDWFPAHLSRAPPVRHRGAGRGPSRRLASGACRPAGLRRARTGDVPVPTRTRPPTTCSSPGRSELAGGWPAAGWPVPVTSATGPSFTRMPCSCVHAPGAGVQARISRLIAGGWLTPVNFRVRRGDLRREADAVSWLRAGLELACIDPVQRRHEQFGASDAQPVQQVTGSVIRTYRFGQTP